MSTNALAVLPQYEDEALLATIRDTVCKGATPAQFRMFIEVCKSTGLNPFLKEIWFVPSVGVMAARDGYLRIANQHPQFDGMETRVERDERNVPIKAVCTVWRKDRGHPIIAEAYYNEYKKSGNVWQNYPSAMIAKVAEVLALKRSFAINGVVAEEEIGTQGSTEAQAEYLATKGLEPYIAPKRIGIDAGGHASGTDSQVNAQGRETQQASNVKSPSNTVSPETIRELSDELDKPSTIKTIEIRKAAQDAEAEEAMKGAEKPKRKKGRISFEALRKWGELKDELRKLTGTDTVYYSALKAKGYGHADEIATEADAAAIWKVLGAEVNRLKQDAELTQLLAVSSEAIGARAFADLLGLHGCLTIEDVLGLASDPLQALLSELKTAVDGKQVAQ